MGRQGIEDDEEKKKGAQDETVIFHDPLLG
jgi:hypothetical protein